MIVVTDGLSIDNVLSPIQQLVAMKVDVFAVGVGKSVRKAQHQLLTIAKDPQHLYLIDFVNLESLVTRISKKTCEGKSFSYHLLLVFQRLYINVACQFQLFEKNKKRKNINKNRGPQCEGGVKENSGRSLLIIFSLKCLSRFFLILTNIRSELINSD